MKLKIKKGDQVLVIAGKNRGARGRVLRMLPSAGKAVVEGVNMIKRHTKPNPQRQVQGGVVEREAPIPLAKLMVIDPDSGKPTRVGWRRIEEGGKTKSVRVAKVSGAMLS